MRVHLRLFIMLPLLLVLGLAGCDNDNDSNAREEGPEAPAPGPETESASTTFMGKVIPQGQTSCSGGIAGFMDGDEVEAVLTPTTGKAGTAAVTINGGSDGMLSCTADGGEFENIDTPPSAFIVCKVTMVSSQITGIKVDDVITVVIDFSGESPGTKQVAIEVLEGGSGCLLIQLESLNATSG